MDIKELKSLVEAYQQVHAPEQLDEISQKTATRAYAASSTGEFEGQDSPRDVKRTDNLRRQIKRKFGDKAAQHADRAAHAMTFGRDSKFVKMPKKPTNEELDIFDVVLEFLQTEGYAETLEEAEWMMANELGAEDIANIIGEALTGERYKEALKKGKMYSRMHSADPEKRPTRGGRGGKQSDFGSPDRGGGHKSMRRRGMKVPQGDD